MQSTLEPASPASCPVSELRGTWWVCQTRPRYESRLSKELVAARIDHYLPQAELIRHSLDAQGRQIRRRVTLPAFPCYVFFCGDIKARNLVAYSQAKTRIIDVSNQQRFIGEISAIQSAIDSGTELRIVTAPKIGHRVRINDGPLMGLQGIVERIGSHRIYLTVEMLGTAAEAQVQPSWIEPIDAPCLN